MHSLVRRTSVVLLAVLGAACGSGASESSRPAAEPEAESLIQEPVSAALRTSSSTPPADSGIVYVVHGINGRDLGARRSLPVDVSVNGACAIKHLTFRSIVGPLTLPAGSYDIAVRLVEKGKPACGGTTAIDAKGIQLPAGANVSIVAHLAAASTPTPTATVFVNDVAPLSPGEARISPRHTANFGAVDVLVNGKAAFTGVTNGKQGTAVLPPGIARIGIAPASQPMPALQQWLRLKPFTFTAAYVVGTPANGTLEILAQRIRVPRAPAKATVYVVHGIDGRDLGAPAALPVDVAVNGGCALQKFEFGKFAGPLALPAGSYDIRVSLADDQAGPCAGPVAIDAKGVALTAGANVSIVAHLAKAETPTPTATVFANDLRPAGFKARLSARHAANFGAVDVGVDGKVAFAGVENGEQGTAKVWPGQRRITISAAGSATPAFDQTLKLDPFRFYAGYAVGTPKNGTFQVLLQSLPLQFNDHHDWWDDDDSDEKGH